MNLHEQVEALDRDALAGSKLHIEDKLNPASSIQDGINYRDGWLKTEVRYTD